MTWHSFHNRGDILQAVIDTAAERADGVLPMDLPGVSDAFRDELDLLATLQLKWHARLSGNIERALMGQPMDLEDAVATAWRRTGDELPGIRLIIDRCTEAPADEAMARALDRIHEKEWIKLAAAAGLANDESPAAQRAGHRIEQLGRAAVHDPAAPEPATDGEQTTPSLAARIKAAIVA